jgi:hypothetical protein
MVNAKLFEDFADYLLNHSEPAYAYGTMVQYISGAFNSIRDRYPQLQLWTQTQVPNANGFAPKWYVNVRRKILRTKVSKCVADGDKLQEKSEPIGRSLVAEIAKCLMKQDDNHSIEMRAAYCANFHCCGRTGEIATASYGTSFWDDVIGTLKTDWSMEKVSEQKLLYLFPDYSDYRICVFHSIACLMICGNGRRHYIASESLDSHYMFANLAYSNCPVSVMNKTLKSMVMDKNKPDQLFAEGLTDDHTGTGFRIGSINHIIANQHCDYKHAVMRSGHDSKHLCAIFEYMFAMPSLVCIAGRVLADYPNPTMHTYVPRLVFLTDENEMTIRNVIVRLFHIDNNDFQYLGKLWKYMETLLAVFIMHFFNYHDEFKGSQKPIVEFNKVCTEFNIDHTTIRKWSIAIKDDFVQRNSHVLHSHNSNINELSIYLNTSMSAMTARFDHIDQKLTRQMIINQSQNAKIDELLLALKSLQDTVMTLSSSILHSNVTPMSNSARYVDKELYLLL